MKLIDSKDDTSLYEIEELKDIKDLIQVINQIIENYGEIGEIETTNMVDNHVDNRKKYKNIQELSNSFTEDDTKNLGLVNFKSVDGGMSFMVNFKAKTLLESNNKNLDNNSNKGKIKYLKDAYDNVIKFDMENTIFYVLGLDGVTWERNNAMLGKYYSGDLEEIEFDESKLKR